MHFQDIKNVISSAHFGTAVFLCKAVEQLTCIHRRCHHSFLVTPRQGEDLPSLSLQRTQDRHFSTTVKRAALSSVDVITYYLHRWDIKSLVIPQIQIIVRILP